ncbi:MAG: hypothetical protein ACREPJ_01965, partial [Rhodanobacteraceae bacterium]
VFSASDCPARGTVGSQETTKERIILTITCKTRVPTFSGSFRGDLQLHRRSNPESSFPYIAAKSWIPGSIADEAGDGPGMTRFL